MSVTTCRPPCSTSPTIAVTSPSEPCGLLRPAYGEMQSRGNAIPSELDQAVAAGLVFVARPCDPRALVALCQATLVLMEWRSLRFAETRYLPSQARLAETS